MVGILVVLLLSYSSQFPEMQKRFEKTHTNVAVSFYDYSVQRLNPSAKLLVDGKLVYQTDSIHKSASDNFEFKLEEGEHIVEVSTLEGLYLTTDTIEITDYLSEKRLVFKFRYNPPIDEYIVAVTEFFYQRKLKEKDYTAEEKEQLLKGIRKAVELDISKDTNYRPTSPNFICEFAPNYMLL